MITVHLSGGLGNQMFQYAAGYALAQKNRTDVCLDLSEFASYRLRDYMLGRYNLPANVNVKNTRKSPMPGRLKKLIPNPHTYHEPHYHFDPEFFKAGEKTHIHGYFQSEKYFKNIRRELQEQFKLKEPLSEKAAGIQKKIEDAPVSVSLHVRRGDYVSDAKTKAVHGSVSEEYYRTAVQRIKNLHGENILFFVFSDEPEEIGSLLSFCENKYIVDGLQDRPHEDMYLMSCCDHHIIANSSFSWWGAWLNEKENKTVIAPSAWFSPRVLLEKNTKDLLPEGWIKL